MTERTVFQSMSQRHVVSVAPTATVLTAAACVMTRANCGSVLIIDASNTLLGIVTERDLMTRVLAKALNPATTTGVRRHDAQSRLCRARNQGDGRGADHDRARLSAPAHRRLRRTRFWVCSRFAMPCRKSCKQP